MSVIVSNKIFEVQKHLALTRHSYNNWVNVMNAKKFASLSPADQQILREESKAAGEMMRKALAAAEQAQIAELRAKGMLITQPDTKPFKARMAPAYKKIAGYAGEENVKIFLKMVDDLRAK